MTGSSPGHTIYFHGLPGAPGEFASAIGTRPGPAQVTVVDRLAGGGHASDEALLALLEPQKHSTTPNLTLMGFSLGAMPALRLAALRPQSVARVDLFSPAAPLELGDFLPLMAGRVVFEAARTGALASRALAAAQSVVARMAPLWLTNQMFTDSPPAERALLAQPMFRKSFVEGMRHSLVDCRPAYVQEIDAYVRPWSGILRSVQCDVRIWHGALDTWAPPAMAHALAANLPGRANVTICDGLAHYSTLHAVLPTLV